MPTLKVTQFSGILPRIHPTLLPDDCATRAHNCVLKSGKLEPLCQPAKAEGLKIRMENGLSSIGEARSLFLWHRGGSMELLAWPGRVHVAGSNLAVDPSSRIFVSGETGIGDNEPAVYMATDKGDGVTRYSLVKEPLPAPVATIAPPEDEENVRYTVFFQTWVDKYGYESPASMPSAEKEYNDGQTVTIGMFVGAPEGAAKRRIYKVVAGTESESIQYVNEQNVVGGNFPAFSFALRDEDAGEIMPQMVGIPNDLDWLTRVPGGFYAGISRKNKREVRFSEVNIPVSWPDAYAYAIHDDIVGMAVTLNSVYILTTGMPWVIGGTAPEAMASSVLASPQGCVSARSICTMEGAVFYVSADGVCMLQDGNASVRVLTEGAFTKREWAPLVPESAIMAAYDGALYLWFTATRKGFILHLNDGKAAVSTHDEIAKALFVDPVTDKLYFVREG